MQLIFLGAPGTSSGTQAALLSERWQVPYISVGNLLRAEVAAKTILGAQAHTYMQVGDLVPDGLVLELMSQSLEQRHLKKSWILDGFPRNLAQAYALHQWLDFAKQSRPIVVCFEVAISSLTKRTSPQEGTHNTRKTNLISRRWEVYQQETMPLIALYQKRGQLKSVDSSLPVHEVTQKVIAALEPAAY